MMNANANRRKNQVKVSAPTNIFEQEELKRKADDILKNLKPCTWRDLECNRKFAKNDKLTFITEEMLIVGCDIGSETHYIRAVDFRGIEVSKKPFGFVNDAEGFQNALAWMLEQAAKSGKTQIVMGVEPTGHYWFCLASWMVAHGVSVVQVNPYAVKQTKELEDNSQLKDDRKDPKLIANLVKDGNYGMPYLPEGVYAQMRGLSMFRDQLAEDRIREINRLHRDMKIHFPEYKDAFGKVEGAFCLEVLKKAPFPEDIAALGEEGLKNIWREARLRGRGYSRASDIVKYAERSVGPKEGMDARREAVKWRAKKIVELDEKLAEVEQELHIKCLEIPHAENIEEISGIGGNILSGVLAEMGDISRFDDAKEIQKLSGLGLVACSSGKHKGETRISYRGRKRLRYWLFQAAKSAVAHSAEFKELHQYYTTRAENPLKKMQSLIVIACKILRIIFAMLRTGERYDPERMLRDIRRQTEQATAA